jgi:hypothetical protein
VPVTTAPTRPPARIVARHSRHGAEDRPIPAGVLVPACLAAVLLLLLVGALLAF